MIKIVLFLVFNYIYFSISSLDFNFLNWNYFDLFSFCFCSSFYTYVSIRYYFNSLKITNQEILFYIILGLDYGLISFKTKSFNPLSAEQKLIFVFHNLLFLYCFFEYLILVFKLNKKQNVSS